MANLLETGASWLANQLKAHASTDVIYVRGIDQVPVKATIGKTEFEFTAPELAGQYFESEQDIFTTGQPLVSHREPIFDHDSGSRRWVLTTKIPFHDTQGHLKGLVGMNRG